MADYNTPINSSRKHDTHKDEKYGHELVPKLFLFPDIGDTLVELWRWGDEGCVQDCR